MSAFTINTTCEGNLVDDPILRQTNGGLDVCNFRIAVTTRSQKNGQDMEHTEFINVVAWNALGVNTAASLSKGDRAIVSGDLRNRQFDGKDGETHRVTEIVAQSVGVSLRWHVVAGVNKAKDALVPA